MDVTIKNLFSNIPDPRIDRTKKHPLESILYIVLCGTMAGIDSWIGYQDYAEEHEEILKQFIDMPNGPPSHIGIKTNTRPLHIPYNCALFRGPLKIIK